VRACHSGVVGSLPVSPASPEKAISVCELSTRVLSSEALRMVAPRMAAFEEAMSVKSLPVMPSRTSLVDNQHGKTVGRENLHDDGCGGWVKATGFGIGRAMQSTQGWIPGDGGG